MPYKTPPARIRNLIPAKHGQELWTNVVNSQLKAGKSESVAMASAWAALKEADYVKSGDKWVRKSSPTVSSVHVPSTELDKEETYRAPAGARATAARAIRWKEKYGDQVKGGTQVGWTRASQLANNENLSRETVARMASFFARHKGNEKVAPIYQDEPWRDAGHVAWLLWGGDAGAEWSRRVMDNMKKRQIDDHTFSDPDSARMASMNLGLEGRIHVTIEEGQQGFYRPGKDEDEYEMALEQIAGIESEPEEASQEKSDLIERVIAAIINVAMEHETVNKRASAEILKVDEERRLIWAWAYVSTQDGKLLTDTQGDSIEPDEMEKMATDFMLDARTAKAMHAGEGVGEFVHSMPLTKEIMDAFGIYSDCEGWITCLKVNSDEAWSDYKSGKYTGLSIGGRADKEKVK